MPTDHDLVLSTSAGRSGGSSAAAALTAAKYPLHFQPGTGARPQQAVRRDQQRLVVLVAVVFGQGVHSGEERCDLAADAIPDRPRGRALEPPAGGTAGFALQDLQRTADHTSVLQ